MRFILALVALLVLVAGCGTEMNADNLSTYLQYYDVDRDTSGADIQKASSIYFAEKDSLSYYANAPDFEGKEEIVHKKTQIVRFLNQVFEKQDITPKRAAPEATIPEQVSVEQLKLMEQQREDSYKKLALECNNLELSVFLTYVLEEQEWILAKLDVLN